MKQLVFYCRGEWFKVRENGDMIQQYRNNFSGQWKFLGVAKYWSQNNPVIKLDQIFKDPKTMLKGYVFDLDHGTTRKWLGGGEVRVLDAFVEEVKR